MFLMASLPFDMFYSHLILVSYGIHTLIHLKKGRLKELWKLRTGVLQSVFFITLLSTIYAINQHEAFNEWGKQVTIFLFPIFFCLNPLDINKYKPQLLLSFSLVCTVTILYLYLDAFLTIRHYHLPYSIIMSGVFTNHNFSQPIDIHATFFSMQIAIALVYLLSVLISEKLTLTSRIVYIICCLVLTAGIIQLSSKSVFVALFLVLNIAFPYFLIRGLRQKAYILISASAFLVIVLCIFSSHALKNRFLYELKEDLSPTFAGQTVEPRLERWKIAVKLIGESPVIGCGAGSEIQLLQQQYFAKKFYSSYVHRLNAHNEYMSFMLKSGIWGLAVYLATLLYGFKKAIKKRDIVFFSFMVIIATVSLSENVLDVDKGVIFYSFFFSFFVFSSEQKEYLNLPIKRHKYLRKVATKHVVVPS